MNLKRAITVAFAALLVVVASPAWSAGQAPGVRMEVGTAVAHDVSRPLSEAQGLPQLPPGFQIEIPLRAAPPRNRPNVSQGQDPGRQTDATPIPGAAATQPPTVNVPGLSDDDNSVVIGGRVVPPDTEGDIGPNHYVQWINLIIGVWDVTRNDTGVPTAATLVAGYPKAGNAVFAGFTGSAAADACRTTNNGDPIVLYDHLADRWLLSQFAINSGVQCFAISTTPDPTGTYFRYAFVVSPGEQNDYPKIGLMPEAYYLSTRDFPSNDGTFAGFAAFDRAAMLAGSASPAFVKFNIPCLTNNCPDGVQPPHLEGPAPAPGPGIFTRAWDDDFDGPLTGSDGYRMWALDADFANPGNSTFTELPFVPSLTGWDSTVCGFFQRGCIPQPSPGERVDPVDELQMYRAQYRHFTGHDSLLVNTTVDADGANTAGVHWAELRNSGSGWGVFQEGTYAPADGENRWMGSAAMNGLGDIALGFNVSSGATFPSLRYTTRTSADPLGVLPGGEVELIAGAGAQTASSNRWGDYAAMSVDPVDDCTFWFTGEYYENTNSFDFKTRIGAMQGPSCGCVPTEPTEMTCTDGLDNDCDGLVDCADPDCSTDPACACDPSEVPGSTCTDGLDNDCDGLIDCDDPDCATDPACACDVSEVPGLTCNDGLDNDCDGLIDCNDPDCATDPLCQVCLLGQKGDPCVVDADCCSNKCRGKAGAKTCK